MRLLGPANSAMRSKEHQGRTSTSRRKRVNGASIEFHRAPDVTETHKYIPCARLTNPRARFVDAGVVARGKNSSRERRISTLCTKKLPFLSLAIREKSSPPSFPYRREFRRGFLTPGFLRRAEPSLWTPSATVFLQDRLQNQAEQEVHETRWPDVAMTVPGSECHIEQNGSVGDPFRRTDQQHPLARVRPLDRLET